MSLSKQDLEYYKNKFFTECRVPAFTKFKFEIVRVILGFTGDYKTVEDIAKQFKVPVHIADSAALVAKAHIKKWVEKHKLSVEEADEILSEVFK